MQLTRAADLLIEEKLGGEDAGDEGRRDSAEPWKENAEFALGLLKVFGLLHRARPLART